MIKIKVLRLNNRYNLNPLALLIKKRTFVHYFEISSQLFLLALSEASFPLALFFSSSIYFFQNVVKVRICSFQIAYNIF